MTDKGWGAGEKIPSRRASNVMLAGAALFLAVAAALGWYGARKTSWHRISTPDLRAISRATSLKFPPSARLVRSHLYQFQDDRLFAQLEMDRNDLLALTRSLSPYRKMRRGEVRSVFSPRSDAPPWWNPEPTSECVAIQCLLPDLAGFDLLITAGDGRQRATVYLYWFRL